MDASDSWAARRRGVVLIAIGAVALSFAVPAAAQQSTASSTSSMAVAAADQNSASTSTSAQQADQLQEVLVTAERRTENLQRTPIAATVLSADALVQKGVVTMSDLQNASPALTFTPAGLNDDINIRGIGQVSGLPAVVPGVAVYRDGLWQPPVVTTDTLYDVERVQVLRGPQGTFVGSNSTGGAILINSMDPDFSGVHGTAQLQLGNYDDVGFQAAVNLPIDEEWAVRTAADMEQRDSFYQVYTSKLTPSPALFSHPGSLDEKNIRVSLLGKPTDDFTVLLKVEINDKSTGGYAYKPTPGTEYYGYAPANPFLLNYDTPTQNDEFSVRSSLRLEWTFGDTGITLRSLSGDQFMRVHNLEDADGTDSTLPGPPQRTTAQAVIDRPLTEEINLISPDTGRLQWVAGAFLLHDSRDIDLNERSQSIPNELLIDFQEVLKTVAAFGQISYQLTEPLQLQAGIRYTHDSLVTWAGSIRVIAVTGAPPFNINEAGSETDGVTTGKVALNWTLDPENFLYAFVAKGSKAGGFNAGTPETTFAPEIVWDYEIGWKGTYFDNHLRTSLGLFYDNYDNLQVNALNPSTGQESLVNTGRSIIKGSEFELHGRFGGFSVDAGAAYVNSRLGAIRLVNTETLPPGTDLPQCSAIERAPDCFNYAPYTVSLDGDQNPLSPEWTYNVGMQYAYPLGHNATLTPRINYSYIGSQWTTLFEKPVTDNLPAYGLWSASLTYQWKQWQVLMYGLNLANKIHVDGQFNAGSNPDFNFYGNPRQFGARISRRF
jgi:iron complex outermembrane receptor protein